MKAKTGTRQWAPNSGNCCLGCNNDCRYCYAKKTAIRYGWKTKENWSVMEYNPRSEMKIRKYDGRVMFPTSHDLHIENKDWWMPFLTGLLEKGNEVLIVSKPQFKAIRHIVTTFHNSPFKDKIEFRFTIGSANEAVLRFWEPNAPSFYERACALHLAKEYGFRTSMSIEPMLDEDPSLLIDLTRMFVTGTIWIGTMNHMSSSDFTPDEHLMYRQMLKNNSLEVVKRVYEEFKDDPKIRWKDSIQKMLGLAPYESE